MKKGETACPRAWHGQDSRSPSSLTTHHQALYLLSEAARTEATFLCARAACGKNTGENILFAREPQQRRRRLAPVVGHQDFPREAILPTDPGRTISSFSRQGFPKGQLRMPSLPPVAAGSAFSPAKRRRGSSPPPRCASQIWVSAVSKELQPPKTHLPM